MINCLIKINQLIFNTKSNDFIKDILMIVNSDELGNIQYRVFMSRDNKYVKCLYVIDIAINSLLKYQLLQSENSRMLSIDYDQYKSITVENQ